MIGKPLLLKIYEAASMQRWNDQIRTIELTELDKQAQKMVLIYILGKCEEEINDGREIDWLEIIEIGIFEMFKRITLTDLKPPLIDRIREDKKHYRELNRWIFDRISPVTEEIGSDFNSRFKEYLFKEKQTLEAGIVGAAHFYVTEWEFDIIKKANPRLYLVEEIAESISKGQSKYSDLECMEFFLNNKKLVEFADTCSQLRFHQRWSHLYRIPKTSVLGHMLIVAIFSFLFSCEAGLARENCINNYFTGLFHDLPEVLTRDIINPVKKSVKGLDGLIKSYEIEEMQKKIYKLIPGSWHGDIKMFTEDEFSDTKNRNGTLVKGADDLAAFIEAYLALKNGVRNENLTYAKRKLRDKYGSRNIEGINFGNIYADFR
ncbi:MAG: HD domain-containing protein [Actinomycetota bacterium]|nr:HD domain-containing protein [Actinomycetota bacterium]